MFITVHGLDQQLQRFADEANPLRFHGVKRYTTSEQANSKGCGARMRRLDTEKGQVQLEHIARSNAAIYTCLAAWD